MQKVGIYQADTGGFVLVTPEKCLHIPTMGVVLSEIRSAFRQDNNGEEQQQPCPYCSSTDTIGHGLRETGKQVLTRRFCKTCNKTWVSGREQRITVSTKEQVAFLKLLDYSETDISELVHRSKSTVRAHLENIEVAEYQAKEKVEAEQKYPITSTGKPEATTENTILAQAFDRTKAFKERIGNFTVWDYNGRLATSEKGMPEVVYLTKDSILHMKMLRKQGKQKFTEYLSQLPEAQRGIISEFIETLIDEDLGMFPMVKMPTHITNDVGEIDASEFEQAGW